MPATLRRPSQDPSSPSFTSPKGMSAVSRDICDHNGLTMWLMLKSYATLLLQRESLYNCTCNMMWWHWSWSSHLSLLFVGMLAYIGIIQILHVGSLYLHYVDILYKKQFYTKMSIQRYSAALKTWHFTLAESFLKATLLCSYTWSVGWRALCTHNDMKPCAVLYGAEKFLVSGVQTTVPTGECYNWQKTSLGGRTRNLWNTQTGRLRVYKPNT